MVMPMSSVPSAPMPDRSPGAGRRSVARPETRRPARAAPLPARGRPARDHGADVGRAARDRRRPDPRRAPRGCLLALSARPRRSVPDAGRHERPRPLPDRPRACPVRRGRHRRVAADARAAGHPRRQGRRALPVGPRHRPAPLRRLDAVGAAHLARPDRRRPQRPDRGARGRSATRTSPSSAPSPTCWPGSSRRAASRPRPRRGSRRSRPSTRRAAS